MSVDLIYGKRHFLLVDHIISFLSEPSIIFIAGGSDSVGFGYEFDVEVLDLKDSNSACAAIPDTESSSLFSTANTFQGKAVFCGGDQTERKCYIFNPDSYLWENFAHLIHPRQNHASIQLSEDSFWILGKMRTFKKVGFENNCIFQSNQVGKMHQGLHQNTMTQLLTRLWKDQPCQLSITDTVLLNTEKPLSSLEGHHFHLPSSCLIGIANPGLTCHVFQLVGIIMDVR